VWPPKQKIGPISSESELKTISTLIDEINDVFGLNFDTDPDLSIVHKASAGIRSANRIILVARRIQKE
jgi:hypothetical protein